MAAEAPSEYGGAAAEPVSSAAGLAVAAASEGAVVARPVVSSALVRSALAGEEAAELTRRVARLEELLQAKDHQVAPRSYHTHISQIIGIPQNHTHISQIIGIPQIACRSPRPNHIQYPKSQTQEFGSHSFSGVHRRPRTAPTPRLQHKTLCTASTPSPRTSPESHYTSQIDTLLTNSRGVPPRCVVDQHTRTYGGTEETPPVQVCGCMQPDCMQPDCMQQGCMQQGCMPQGCMPQGCMPQGCMPQECMPQGCMPQGCMPQGCMQAPGSAARDAAADSRADYCVGADASSAGIANPSCDPNGESQCSHRAAYCCDSSLAIAMARQGTMATAGILPLPACNRGACSPDACNRGACASSDACNHGAYGPDACVLGTTAEQLPTGLSIERSTSAAGMLPSGTAPSFRPEPNHLAMATELVVSSAPVRTEDVPGPCVSVMPTVTASHAPEVSYPLSASDGPPRIPSQIRSPRRPSFAREMSVGSGMGSDDVGSRRPSSAREPGVRAGQRCAVGSDEGSLRVTKRPSSACPAVSSWGRVGARPEGWPFAMPSRAASSSSNAAVFQVGMRSGYGKCARRPESAGSRLYPRRCKPRSQYSHISEVD